MLGELTARAEDRPRDRDWAALASTWYLRGQYALAFAALAGLALLAGIIATKRVFLGSDSANDYAHVWYISDQLFHHGRLPLHIATLESGNALTFPYAVIPWLVTAVPFAIFGDRAVTLSMVLGFALYGYAATRARPALRDPRLLCLIYVNTFLIESLVSFQMAFIYACVFFFLFIEAVDKRHWVLATLLAIATVSTHPFAGGAGVTAYVVYAAARRPADVRPLFVSMVVAAIALAPFALYIRTAPAASTTSDQDLMGTLRFIARYRGLVILLPLIISAFAPAFRTLFVVVFVAMALTFAQRIEAKKVNTFGIARNSHTFYNEFLQSPQFNATLRYRVLEPNDREDGAYRLIQHGVVLTQEFFDQSQFRRWWNSPEQYACFLGAKQVDVVLLERDYPLKWNQNEDKRLQEFAADGRARVIYTDPHPDRKGPRFWAYDVRGARQEGARIGDCNL